MGIIPAEEARRISHKKENSKIKLQAIEDAVNSAVLKGEERVVATFTSPLSIEQNDLLSELGYNIHELDQNSGLINIEIGW
jgi:hypothetical protein